MAASRRTSRLFSRLLSRLRLPRGWRSSAGIAQSAMVGGLVVVSLATTAGVVAYGPQVGSAVADRFICVLGSGDCGHPDDTGLPVRPPARVLTEQPPPTAQEAYDPAGVRNPSAVTPGGSGVTYDGKALTFDRCWNRSNETQNLTNALTQLCTAPDGGVWNCTSTQVTFVIPWPRSANRCSPATESGLPDLVTCSADRGGGQHCVAVTLDSTTTSGGHTDRVYEDPALAATPAYAADQRDCPAARNRCNADLTRGLTDLAAQLAGLHDQYAECDSTLTNTQTELRTIAGPDGQPQVLLHSDSGWVDPGDPTLSPAEKAAAVYLLDRTVQAQQRANPRRSRPAEQLPGMLATVRAVNRVLPNLALPAGLSCQEISAALGHINDGRPGPGDLVGYSTVCARPAADGSCAVWGNAPQYQADQGDAGTEMGAAGSSVQLTPEAEAGTPIPDLVPGDPDATYAEAQAYCRDHDAECARANEAEIAGARAEAYGLLEDMGVCADATACAAFAAGALDAAGDCPAPSGWTAAVLPQGVGRATIGLAGAAICAIAGGGLAGHAIGGWGGAAAGVGITASLVAVIGVIGDIRTSAAIRAAVAVATTSMRQEIQDLRNDVETGHGQVQRQIAQVAQIVPPAEREQYYGDVLRRLFHED